MRSATLLFVDALLLLSDLHAQKPWAGEAKVGAPKKIEQLERDWNAAILKRDVAAASGFLDPDYFLAIGIENHPLVIVPRAEWLKMLNSYELDSQSIDDMHVEVIDNVAVVVMTYRQHGKPLNGRDISGNFLLTDIWIYDGSEPHGWRVAERHSSRLEKSPTSKEAAK